MSAFALPVILVSAKSEAAASHIISEIIDNEPPSAEREQAGEAGSEGRVWRIVTKYYEADVALVAQADAAPPRAGLQPEGLLIYLTEDECAEAGAARAAVSRRAGAAAAGAGAAGAAVRVLAAEGSAAAAAAAARRLRLEPVSLREPARAGGGVAAVRAALHAHAWPGLRRTPAPAAAPAPQEDAVERGEQWAAALGAVEGVRALPPGAERRAAAEALVAAFCRALGEDPDEL